jgi:hypothetical protein
LVRRLTLDQEAAGSNPASPAISLFLLWCPSLRGVSVHARECPLGPPLRICVRLYYSGMGYCAPSGLGWFDWIGTQGIALGYNMAPFQGSVQEQMPSPNGAE